MAENRRQPGKEEMRDAFGQALVELGSSIPT